MIQTGILNVTIDRMWDVPNFQFYMGDLANVVPEAANSYQANDVVSVYCHWNGNEDELMFQKYDKATDVYVQAGMICTIKHYSKELIKLTFLLTIVTEIDPLEDTLNFRTKIINPVSTKF